MKTRILRAVVVCALMALPVATATAQNSGAPPPSAPPQQSMSELEKLVAPIALYPDPLIATLLPASVYPLEIVQAARFVKDTNNIAKLDQQPWDENVKAIARFPEVIAKMDADIVWTSNLGQAFLNQQKEVMDTIQSLRQKADNAGTLKSSPQQTVIVTNTVVEKTVEQSVVYVTNTVVQIEPAQPNVIYVPTYDPWYVYYPPPVYVGPPPVVTFAAGIAMGVIIANNCDWHGGGVWVGGGGMVIWGGGDYDHDVDVDIDIDRDINRGDRPRPREGDRAANRGTQATQRKWQPDQNRLRSSGAAGASVGNRQARGWSSGSTRPATQPAVGSRPGAPSAAARPAQQPALNRPRTPATATQPARQPGVGQGGAPGQRPARPTSTWQQPAANRPATGQAPGVRPSQAQSINRPAQQPATAFGGLNNGANARSFSNRGAVSRGGGGGFRGGGGGRRR